MRRYFIGLLVLFITSCNSNDKEYALVKEVFSKEDSVPVLLFVPEVYCRGCYVNTLKICREKLSPADYLILSPRMPDYLKRNEKFKEISESANIKKYYLQDIYARLKINGEVEVMQLKEGKDLEVFAFKISAL